MIYLHSAEAVGELLKKGKIKVKGLVREYIDDNGQLRREFTEPMDYENWRKLDDESRLNIKVCDENGRNCSKFSSLFPENWTKEDIAKAFEKAEEKIEKGLLEEYGLPKYSPENAGKYWKDVKGEEIKTTINVKGEEIELEIGGKYDSEGNLDLTIQTIYPYKPREGR